MKKQVVLILPLLVLSPQLFWRLINSLPWEGCGWMRSGREGFLRHTVMIALYVAWRRTPYLPFPKEGIAHAIAICVHYFSRVQVPSGSFDAGSPLGDPAGAGHTNKGQIPAIKK